MHAGLAFGIAALMLAGGSALSAQPLPAGTPGSAFEPWQVGGVAAGATSVPSLAMTIGAMPKNLPRAEAPPLDAAIAAARAGVKACADKGAKISLLVTDALGEPIVLLSGDGAGVRSQLIARTKANIVVRYGMPSGDVVAKAKGDPSITAAAAADATIGVLREGGFPVMRGTRMIGTVAASGGSLGGDMTLDETCARAALAVLYKAAR